MANLRANNVCGTGGRNAIDGSVAFTSSSGYLSVTSDTIGTSAFTIEWWFKAENRSEPGTANRRMFRLGANNATGSISINYDAVNNDIQWNYDAATLLAASTIKVYDNSWYHIAAVREGTGSNETKLYINGVLSDSVTFTTDLTQTACEIGRDSTLSDDFGFYGNISNLRVTKSAVYTAAFTPPTEKLTGVTDTILLCCQDSDDATQEATGKTITGYGKLNRIGIGTAANASSSDWMNTGDQDMTITGRSYMTTGGANPSGVSKKAMLPLDSDHNYSWYVNATTVSDNVGVRGYYGGSAENLPSSPGYIESTGEYSGVVGAGATAFEFIVWQNDSAVLEGINIVKLDPGKAPKVLPPVGVDEGVTFEGDTKVNTQGYMYFPTGDTSQRGRGRAVMGGFYVAPNAYYTNIEYLSIQSLGNSIKFGDLTLARTEIAACSSSTRALFAGGSTPGPTTGGTKQNIIDYVTIATTANAINFGDLTSERRTLAGCSNETRGIFGGGIKDPARRNIIDYITIASTGDAADFGDLTEQRRNVSAHSSTTRGIFAGGLNPGPAYVNTIDYITIATTGDATNFGDLTALVYATTSCSNSTRGVIMGGTNPSGATNVINYVTIASTGDGTDFGDLTLARSDGAGVASPTRGLMVGGETPSDDFNTIDYVTIATTGNSSDFGDASVGIARGQAGSSDCHGGIS